MLKLNGYNEELRDYVSCLKELLDGFRGKSFFISGAAGLIGSYLIDLLIVAEEEFGLEIEICACDRNVDLLNERFPDGVSASLSKLTIDICQDEIPAAHYDYVIHAASNTSPVDYAQKPIDTIWTNVYGAKRLLELAASNQSKRFLFCSSVEAYGRNNGDTDKFTEDYSGYVNSNTVRANYPAAKRCVEALCNAYAAEHPAFDFVIARIGRFYGPTVIPGDSKAPSQFIGNAVRGEDIVLKSDGTQLFSWGYVGDCATALLTILARGECGHAYNVADPGSCAMLREFAQHAAHAAGVKLRFVQQSQVEQAGYSKITKATMATAKIEALGWTAAHHLADGISRTVRYLRQLNNLEVKNG